MIDAILLFSRKSTLLAVSLRLAAKGIEPNQIQPGYRSSDAVSVGKTLLQELMNASVENMQTKLALYKQHKTEHCKRLITHFP